MNDVTQLDQHLPEALRLPPNSVEAEQAVLGGLMLNNDAWDQVSERVGEHDFYRKDHRLIFRVMVQLVEQDQPRDLVTVSEALENLGQLESAGGIAYLSELSRNTPSAANISAYADIVRERSILRQLIQISQKVADRAFRPEGASSNEILDQAESAIFEIAEQQNRGTGPEGIKSILKKAVDRIDELYRTKSAVTGLSTGFTELDRMTSGMQPADMIVVAARPSMGKCIMAGSRLVDPETGALVTIDELVAAQRARLLTLDDRFRLGTASASAFVDDGIKPVFRVRTASGREICTTLTHPFLTGDGWQPLGQIGVGERVAVPRQIPVFGHDTLPEHEVRALAYFIADGGTTQTCPMFTNRDERLLADFEQAVAAFGGHQCRRIDDGQRTPTLRVSRDMTLIADVRAGFAAALKRLLAELRMTGEALSQLLGVSKATVSYWCNGRAVPAAGTFEQLCVALNVTPVQLGLPQHDVGAKNGPNGVRLFLAQHGVWARSALEKSLPEAVFRLPRSQLALFLNRLFACDGSAFVQGNGQARISYASSSPALIRGVQHLLLRFGVLAKVRRKQHRYPGLKQSPCELEIMDQASLATFVREIGIFGKEDAVARVMAALDGKRAHSNRDSLPPSVNRYVLARKGDDSWADCFARIGEACPPGYNPHLVGRSERNLSRSRAAEFARLFDDDYLASLATSDVYWDEITSIDYIGEHQVYDLTVPGTHNFVAEDFCVHNTTFAMNLVEHVAIKEDKPVLVFSMEMPSDSLVMRMLSSLGRINQQNVRSGRLEADDWPRISSAIQLLSERKLYIDDTGGLSPMEMRARARRVARECGGKLGLIMIDYLQLMQVPGSDNRVNEISEISRSVKGLAKELEVPVVVLSQLNRSLEQRPNKRPVMSDLRESGAIEQDADVIVFLYRDEVYNKDSQEKGIAEIIIGKQRNGPIGTIRLAFRGEFTRFDDLAPEYYQDYGE